VRRFWKRHQHPFDIEGELRANRPEPRDDFVHGAASRLSEEGAGRGFARARVAFAAGLVTVILVALAATGGLGHAASAGKKGKRATPGQAQYAQYGQYKVTICHRTGSAKHRWVAISVSSRALTAHMRHGDFIITPARACPPR